MGHPITQEDLDLIETINFNNCIIYYKKIFYFMLIGYFVYNSIYYIC